MQADAALAPTIDDFRLAMSRLGAAVHIVTTDGAGGKTGVTATAVCSVSDSPPTLLACLNRNSRAAAVVVQNGIFAVNTLAAGHTELSDVFAGRKGLDGEARFTALDEEWYTLATAAPALRSASVVFDCVVHEIKPMASHLVMFGLVKAVSVGPDAPALMYYQRAYRSI